MSQIAPCRTCGKDVATSTDKCPHCGESYPTTQAAISGVLLNGGLLLGALIVVLFLLGWMF